MPICCGHKKKLTKRAPPLSGQHYAQYNSYTNTDCIYSVYVMVLELIVQIFYLGSNKNRPQPQIVNIRVIYRFEVRFVSL